MYNKILVPVIFDEGHDTRASYLVARKLAKEGTEFFVLHVLARVPNYVTAEIPTEVLDKSRAEAEKSLRQSAKAVDGAKPYLVQGDAGRSIVDFADKHEIDCIVMASHQLGLTDIFLGSTASRVVRHAKCSVHVIR